MSQAAQFALGPEALRRRCDPHDLPFSTTAELAGADGELGQQRALQAIDFAVGMSQRGYNVLATGPEGTAKLEVVEARLRRGAAGRPAPSDVVFLFNFDDPVKRCARSCRPVRQPGSLAR